MLRQVPIEQIDPLWQVVDAAADDAKVKKLADVMRARRWGEQRPLLVVEFGDRVTALTGAHQYFAARMAALVSVPCLVVDSLRWQASGLDFALVRQLPAAEREAALRNAGLTDAADLCRQELEAIDDLILPEPQPSGRPS